MRNRRERARAKKEAGLFEKEDSHQNNVIELRPDTSHRIAVPVTMRRSNIPLIILAYSLFVVTLGINATFAFDRASTLPDKILMAVLGIILEAMLFYLPSQASSLSTQRRWVSCGFASILCVFLFASGLMASLGFASHNLIEVTTIRAERITPAISDAQSNVNAISASRDAECQKRGPLCRQLEKDATEARARLTDERNKVSVTADPQTTMAAKLIAWVSLERFHPSADDFAMLRLFLLTLLPQLGGLVLMVASKARS